MNKYASLISQLFAIRNRYEKKYSFQKLKLLVALGSNQLKGLSAVGAGKKTLQTCYDTLLFLQAFPDNASVYQHALQSLQQLQLFIQSNKKVRDSLYNTGITGTQLCAAFSFEIVKWLRNTDPEHIRLSSFEANDAQIQSILSAVMPKVESEILQDANANWKSWFKLTMKKGEEILDRFIAIFNETDIRPEVRDELWNAIGVNVEIDFPSHDCLPDSLINPYYHRSLIRKNFNRQQQTVKPIRINPGEKETESIIECSRKILIRHLREIDPVTFTAAHLVSYYSLHRGLSVALMGMVPERRHPIDSYFGYVVFKNGLPVAYAGSWILFDSGRIGLNIFPSYRGGESQYIFDQVLKLHKQVYNLKRFSVDPYQIGKENHDGIQSGVFWTYYHAGFRPIRKEQQLIALAEAQKIKSIAGYRSPVSVLKKLADSKLQLGMQKGAVTFDVNDLGLAYSRIIKKKFDNKRNPAEETSFIKLAKLLGIKNSYERNIQFILKNWAILLLSNEKKISRHNGLKKTVKKLFILKAGGSEEDYILQLQKATALRKFLEKIVEE